MLLFVLTMIILYAMPLFVTLTGLLLSDFGRKEAVIVVAAAAVSNSWLATGRDAMGLILVPMLTALALKSLRVDGTAPRITQTVFMAVALLYVLAAVAIPGMMAYGHQALAQQSSSEDLHKLNDVSKAYSKELLILLSTILGISGSTRRRRPVGAPSDGPAVGQPQPYA